MAANSEHVLGCAVVEIGAETAVTIFLEVHTLCPFPLHDSPRFATGAPQASFDQIARGVAAKPGR